ncbi:MAG: primosomal protein N' [Acidobacteria bacterium]|nr:MAG: primosomal protein N' [Acidobacteriota bacterium]
MAAAPYVEVAVPVPLPGPLLYAVPPATAVAPGCRVRVTVGKRRYVGVVTGVAEQAPPGLRIKPLLEVLDREPVLSTELLELARFIADYYLAPIGEVTRVMVPADLPPWGDLRVSLTDGGALAAPRSAAEAALKEALLARPRQRLAELQAALPQVDVGALVERWREQGKARLEQPGARAGRRYVKAVELMPRPLEELLAACGRAPAGRAVVEYLAAVERPATAGEACAAVGCGKGVVRRLIERRVLRQFSQPERLSLGRHRLSSSPPPPLVLRPDQEAAVTALRAALDGRRFAPFLLTGMTGSGKTEVYLRLVAAALDQGRSALMLVPEIALVPALAESVRARFGRRLAIVHSNLSSSERHQEWERVRSGAATVVLGPRSAVFAPLRDLGVIVVDEEHEAAYKQDQTPRYNGRDVALVRARRHGAVALLVSATPSLESRRNVELGKLAPLLLTERVGSGELPAGILVDLRREGGGRRPGEVVFSAPLRRELERSLEDGDQVILLRNRRGYAPILLCRACGEDFRCPDCGLPLTLHRRFTRLECHYCEHARAVPARCPSCDEEALEPIGAGTERVEERFKELYPEVAVDVLDADAVRRPGGVAAVLERFASGRSQVLIGTQMVAKGHHFPRVSLAAVLAADTYLGFPDFRAVERTYALLVQLAGRAGRGRQPGRVVIQTYHPDHYAIRAALTYDDRVFAGEELRFRRTFHYPPYTRLVQLLVQHKDERRARSLCDRLAGRLLRHPLARGVRFAGPAAAPLARLRGRWRYQLLLRAASGKRLRRLLRAALGEKPIPELIVDVDPYDLL